MIAPTYPGKGFASPDFLHGHVRFILDFYEDRVLDANGGFFQTFRDDGQIYDPGLRHLVSSTRFVFNYALAFCQIGTSHYRDWARHGLTYLTERHRQPKGHYAWELREDTVSDGRAMAYGHAFVILAASKAHQAGIEEAKPLINETFHFMETMFFEPSADAYADERDPTLQTLDPYRGQNANMHMCEALLAAYEATGEVRYLDRAERLARRFAGELAMLSDGLIWEHYTEEWAVDLDYNRDKPDDLFKPWGFQPGHQVEWSKLLLQLNVHRPNSWNETRAIELFDGAIANGWDDEHGGLVYGFAPDGKFADANKYFWVQAEATAAAWRLYRLTGQDQYLDTYTALWQWSWNHLVDHKHGAWFRIRTREGEPIDDLKSPPGKTDYHTLGACMDILSQM